MDHADEQGIARSDCDHHYEIHILGGHPITVRACVLCRQPDWPDLYQQAVQLYGWGREEALAGKPAREKLSAYDRPRDEPSWRTDGSAAHNAGPTVREAAADDRRWPLEKAGE